MTSDIRTERQLSAIPPGVLVCLRPLGHEDVGAEYLSWLQDRCVNQFLSFDSQNLSLGRLHSYLDESAVTGRINWAVVVEETGLHIGNASVYDMDFESGTFKMGWFIGNRNYWGGRVALQAVALILSKGFSDLRLDECIGGVDRAHIKARLNNRLVGFVEQSPAEGDGLDRYLHLSLPRARWRKKMAVLKQRFPMEFSWFDGDESFL